MQALLWKLGGIGPLRRLHHRWQAFRWRAGGCVGTPPPRIKQQIVQGIASAYQLRVLVETGTLLGDMIYANRRSFDQIYSIELDRELYERARHRFRRQHHVHIVPGDSASMLAFVLPKVAQHRCLFWLDAHWMEGGVRGEHLTPILRELELVLDRNADGSVILIDDARLFRPGTGYPTIATLRDRLRVRLPKARCVVEQDILHILPPDTPGAAPYRP